MATTTTYAPHPPLGSTEEANAIARPSCGDAQINNEDTFQVGDSGQAIFGRTSASIYPSSFIRLDFGTILAAPTPRSVISAATLDRRAAVVNTLAMQNYVSLVARDGVWDAPVGTIDYCPLLERDTSLQLYPLAGGLGTQILTTGEASSTEYRIKNGTPVGKFRGYDLRARIDANEPSELKFTADKSGRFEYELHGSHLELGALEVRPE